MKDESIRINRRSGMKSIGAVGSAAFLGSVAGPWGNTSQAMPGDWKDQIRQKVDLTPLIDTHEHLIEEEDRLSGINNRIKSNDWSFLLSHYIDSDLLTAGMPPDHHSRFFSNQLDPVEKWKLIEPYWPAVRHTGYGQAVELAMQKLYQVDRLSGETIAAIQERYLKTIQPGFYKTILRQQAGIESCQVNFLGAPFSESRQPNLLMQDLSILGMHMGPSIESYASKAGIEVKSLSDWHRVIDWWFDKYGNYAVAVKTQAAYSRNIDFTDVPAEQAEPPFRKRLNKDPLTPDEQKAIEDHLFWYAVRKATEWGLPVKIHTGYYAGHDRMPLDRIQNNPAACTGLCRTSPDTTFVFMHICYPFYEDMIAVAKHYTNAYLDMCWAWIISPVASVNFLKQYLATAPANKVFAFGGDYVPVEPVLGHALLARRGIAQAIASLVDDGWISLDDSFDLIEMVMHQNARVTFRLEQKENALKSAPWL